MTTLATAGHLQHLLKSAISAHNGTSFDPEKRGQQLIAGYEETLTEDLKLIESATDEAKQRYIDGYVKHLSHYLNARGRIVSPMISGGSNFPVRRMQKYGRWEDSAYKQFKEYREKALKGLQRQIEADKPQAQKNDETWQRIERELLGKISTIIDIDEGRNNYSSRALFVSNLTGMIKRMASNGRTEHVRKSIELINKINLTTKKPIVTANNSIFSLVQVSEERQETKEEVKQKENKTFDFTGGQVIINYEIDRVQIKHDSKPAYEVIQQLKKAAFKWSPSQGVWQRQLTMNAVRASNQITGLNLG